MTGVRVVHGDLFDVLPTLDPDSVDAVVCDPPYSIQFMGRQWDDHDTPAAFAVWCARWAAEALRVVKPGGHLVAFGATRTHHRLMQGVEDAGWEVRDCGVWLYRSGFPKSLDVSKAIDKIKDWTLVEQLSDEIKRARAEIGMSLAEVGEATMAATDGTYGKWYHRGGHMFFETGRSLPSRPEWEQLRQVLPIAPELLEVYEEADREVTGEHASGLAIGTAGVGGHGEGKDRRDNPATDAAARWDGWGTALKPAIEPWVLARRPLSEGTVAANVLRWGTGALNIDGCRAPMDDAGRWPANVVTDVDDPTMRHFRLSGGQVADYPKASTGEKPWDVTARADRQRCLACGRLRVDGRTPCACDDPEWDDATNRITGTSDELHPTVKPLDLMRHLIRLVTPPGGTVLDPFAGTGTTGEAAIIEGMSAILVEREAAYLPLIERRLSKPIQPTLGDVL